MLSLSPSTYLSLGKDGRERGRRRILQAPHYAALVAEEYKQGCHALKLQSSKWIHSSKHRKDDQLSLLGSQCHLTWGFKWQLCAFSLDEHFRFGEGERGGRDFFTTKIPFLFLACISSSSFFLVFLGSRRRRRRRNLGVCDQHTKEQNSKSSVLYSYSRRGLHFRKENTKMWSM